MTVTEQEANRPKCLQDTRVDLLREIRSWAVVTDRPNIFLLIGAAGTGKSTVARTIAEEFEIEGRKTWMLYLLSKGQDRFTELDHKHCHPDNCLQSRKEKLSCC